MLRLGAEWSGRPGRDSYLLDAAPAARDGFRDLVLARSTMNAREVEAHNANYIGGEINGGLSDLRQLFFRPLPRLDPYATAAPDIFLCSSSMPPGGGGVHGMCGYVAARSALARVFDLPAPPLWSAPT